MADHSHSRNPGQCTNKLDRPRCPQVDVDARHLLRIPEEFDIAPEPEDEFECLNLEITCPPVSSINRPLPVLVWIHGTTRPAMCLTYIF